MTKIRNNLGTFRGTAAPERPTVQNWLQYKKVNIDSCLCIYMYLNLLVCHPVSILMGHAQCSQSRKCEGTKKVYVEMIEIRMKILQTIRIVKLAEYFLDVSRPTV